MEQSFLYSIKEKGTELFPFRVDPYYLEPYTYLEALAEQAAYSYFMAREGWRCEDGWPLTFQIFSSESHPLGEALAFVMDGRTPPQFEIITK